MLIYIYIYNYFVHSLHSVFFQYTYNSFKILGTTINGFENLIERKQILVYKIIFMIGNSWKCRYIYISLKSLRIKYFKSIFHIKNKTFQSTQIFNINIE